MLLNSKVKTYRILSFANYLVCNLSKYVKIITINVSQANINVYLKQSGDLFKVLFFLKKHTQSQFVVLTDLFNIDLLNKKNRFQLVYCVLSVRYNCRLKINVSCDENSKIESISELFQSSGWLEREVWDLFGLFFCNHKDLRRILTDYGFEGYPLRKDFPLSGFIEIRYDDSNKRIVYEPVETMQEFRFFDFRSPWEQLENLY